MISELITLLHNQETAKTNFTNNCLILATSTESTINYHKKTISLLYSVNQSLPTTHFSTTTQKKIPTPYIYKSKKNNPENARTKSREKDKKHYLLCNRSTKFFEEARITRSIWNFTMS